MKSLIRADDNLARVYEQEGPRLWRAIFVYAGSRDVASDAVAEAFTQYAERAAKIHSPAAWIWRAAFRIAAGELKRRSTLAPLPFDLAYEMPERVPIFDALAQLSARQRACAVLRYHFGYSGIEIGRILEISPATVRVHILQARRRLKALLEASREN